jgi:hypothetical protein
MSFRADEEIKKGRERAHSRLLGPSIEASQREASRDVLDDLIGRWGPVIETYPHWHPFVLSHEERNPVTTPGISCGYRGLDHTVFLASAIITCPYNDGRDVYESVGKLAQNTKLLGVADLAVEEIDAQLYHPKAKPILITCKWNDGLNNDKTIRTEVAVPLVLEKEVPNWRSSEVAETWATMAPYILGRPCGSRSSLFLRQETGQKLKELWNMLIYTGMFGPIYVGSNP